MSDHPIDSFYETFAEWQQLITEWKSLLLISLGMSYAQELVDQHYERMEEFVKKHPQFKLPVKYICYNAGTFDTPQCLLGKTTLSYDSMYSQLKK